MLARIPPEIRPYLGRIVMTLLAFIAGILMLTLGFWRTMLLVLVTALGYVIGKWKDGTLHLPRLANLRPR